MEMLWEALITNAILDTDRDQALKLFIHLGSSTIGDLRPIPDEVAEHMFTVKFAQLNVSNLNSEEYNFFNYFFRKVLFHVFPLESRQILIAN